VLEHETSTSQVLVLSVTLAANANITAADVTVTAIIVVAKPFAKHELNAVKPGFSLCG